MNELMEVMLTILAVIMIGTGIVVYLWIFISFIKELVGFIKRKIAKKNNKEWYLLVFVKTGMIRFRELKKIGTEFKKNIEDRDNKIVKIKEENRELLRELGGGKRIV